MSVFLPEEQRALFGGRVVRPPRAENAGPLNAGQRSLKWLRDRGWFAEVAEKYIARVEGESQSHRFRGGYRKDLFGFMDILAFRAVPVEIGEKAVNVLAVQTTSRQQMAGHLRSYRDVEAFVARGSAEQAERKRIEFASLQLRLTEWIGTPCCAFMLHGWEPVSVPKKQGGGHKVVWTLSERIVSAADLIAPNF